jgi:transglutaminase-like putative cysteine protease
MVDDAHVTLGWGRDFADVTPMRGVILGGGTQELEVRVTVTPKIEAAINLS